MEKIILLNKNRVITYDLENKNIFQIGESLREMLLILSFDENTIRKILDVESILNENLE